jgi:4,5-dihydroxyphthalate decarboxylase
MPPLKIAIYNYGHTMPLKEGLVTTSLELEHIFVDPITVAMRQMCRTLNYDICEMAFTTYLCAKAAGKPFTAIPVFFTRNFWHKAIFARVGSGIKEPKDLEGRTVIVNRGYTVTTGLWARGILQHDYGVDLKKITWSATDEEHVTEYVAPSYANYDFRGRDVAELLLAEEGAAAIGDLTFTQPEIKSLIPNAFEAGAGFFRRTGIYPLNHSVVIHNDVLRDHPGVADELYEALSASKAQYLAHLDGGRDLSPADQVAVDLGKVVGDPFPYGIAANRTSIEAIVQYCQEQEIIPQRYAIDDLFVPSLLKT